MMTLDFLSDSMGSMEDMQELRPTTSRARYDPILPSHAESSDGLYRRNAAPSALQAAQMAIHEYDQYDTKPWSRRPRSLSAGSKVNEGRNLASLYRNDKDMFEEIPPFAKNDFGHLVETRPRSPMRPRASMDTRRPTQLHNEADKIPVPERQSSRPRKGSAAGTKNEGTQGRQDEAEDRIPRRPRDEEIEAARKILAAAEASSRLESATASPQRVPRSPTVRSATPPPIASRPRRQIFDDFDQSHHPSGPSMRPTDETPPRRATSRPQSVASTSTFPSQALASTRMEPVLDQYQLDNDLRPPRQREFGGVDRSIGSHSRSARDLESVNERGYSDQDMHSQRHGGSSAGTITGHHRRRTYSDDGISTYREHILSSRQSAVSHGSKRMPEFFSEDIFQAVLHNPITAHQLQKFSEKRLCGESVEFLSKVDQYQTNLNNLAALMANIHKSFISDQSPSQINAPRELLKSVHSQLKTTVSSTMTTMETLFLDLQKRIEHSVFTEVYPRFVREKVTLSAIRALANDRHKYQGLGDCFCLTDPNMQVLTLSSKADNPILYASDGFVKVTGYSRREVIPRNCRFLQGAQTDREIVRRLKKALDEEREIVELLLNYRKNGDPFWNLLFMAPLYDESGKLAFFIGGQVNCSTTIHSNVDVMKVLSASATGEAEEAPRPAPQVQRQSSLPSARKAFLKAFGVCFDEARTLGHAGMEQQVLGKMEGQDLDAQMKEFYTAYSKYIVVRADTFVINFYSEGVTEMLHPANTTGLVVGQEVFRFFKSNMMGKETDYRSRVRYSIRQGNPISVEIRLQTRRSARYRGDERFVSHWTPLKDENSAVQWVVITLAPTMG